MNWIFSTDYTLEETKTGFVICLLSGSWLGPADLKISVPDNMTAHEQVKHLRLGLEFANELMGQKASC